MYHFSVVFSPAYWHGSGVSHGKINASLATFFRGMPGGKGGGGRMYDKNGGRQITAIYDSKKRPQFESTKFDEKRC